MTRIVKYLLGTVIAVAVVVVAVVVGRSTNLLVGALVPLAALIVVALLTRARQERAERSGMADWDDLVDRDVDRGDDAFFRDWTATTPHRPDVADPVPTPITDRQPLDPADPHPEVEGEGGPVDDGVTEAPEVRPSFDDDTVRSTGSGAFPFDEDDGFGDLPPLPPHLQHPLEDRLDASDETEGGTSPASTSSTEPSGGAESPAAPPSPGAPVTVPEPARDDALSMAGVGAGPDLAPRRSLIDWTGPPRIVEDAVRTSDDVLAASAATALPTVAPDSSAPEAGSELARLLAKVEARLRDYE